MSYEGEAIVKAVLSRLEENLPAALNAVETKWNADPVKLDEVYEYLFGFHPTLLEHQYREYPLISVMLTSSSPGELQADQWYGQSSYEVFIDTVVASLDEAETSKKSIRFIESILDVLSADSALAVGTIQKSYVPSVELSEVLRQLDQNSKEFFTQQSRIGLGVEG